MRWQEAERLGLRSKRYLFSTGRVRGGSSFSRGQVYHLLRNPVYLGQIRHKEKLWPGAHPAIVDQELWDRVQGKLQDASGRRRGMKPAAHLYGRTFTDAAPLTGRFRDESGDWLTPAHTQRHGRRVRYYISNRLISGGADPTGWRLPAPAFEAAIAKSLADHLAKAARQHAVLETPDASVASSAAETASKLAEQFRASGIDAAAPVVASGEIGSGTLRMELDRDALAEALKLRAGDLNPALLQVEVPFTCRRRGVETRIVAGDPVPVSDAPLLRALRQAYRWPDALRSGRRLAELATQAGHSSRYLARIISLSFLSPTIQKAILKGRQPAALTLETLVRFDLPLDWSEQERQLGFSVDASMRASSPYVSARP